jgi:hypothetical protein
MAGFTISKVVHEHVPIERHLKGNIDTFGGLLDEAIREAINQGENIQTVRFDFDTESVSDMEMLQEMYIGRSIPDLGPGPLKGKGVK